MKIVNIGSLNIDHVYQVSHAVKPGETISASELQKFCGGKGLNQSAALARAGADVYHAGKIGIEGQALINLLKEYGVNTENVAVQEEIPTGHAIIQVDPDGQNCIVVYGGANTSISKEEIDKILKPFTEEDILLLQNETSNVEYAVKKAREKGMRVALNPSPIGKLAESDCLAQVDWFILNEIEGYEITGKSEAEDICNEFMTRYPNSRVMLTLGEKGCVYCDHSTKIYQESFPVKAVDTTAAGDTFTGFFLSGIMKGLPMEHILKMASRAASIAVSRQGAAASIPAWEEVAEYF